MELRIVLEPDPDTDPDQGERLARQLRHELSELDVDDVSTADGAAPPEGAKSGVMPSLTELLVTLSSGGGVFVTVIATIREWLSRRAGADTVTITIDGDTLELNSATPVERAELIDTFVRRHQPV